jgi:hypothetical protein
VVMGPDGKSTQKSLDALYAFVGKNYGENSPVSATYYDTTNYKDAVKYAQNFAKHHACYKLLSNNCKTFAHDAATAQPTTAAHSVSDEQGSNCLAGSRDSGERISPL